jgi:hypothetical protein
MKTRNIIIFTLVAMLTSACHSWDAPSEEIGHDNYGNPSLKVTNRKTIADIKQIISNNSDLVKIEEPMQIIAIVTGNDEGGNVYKSLYIQDNSDAIALSIDQSGMYTALPVGQCILIELQGLYVGAYEKQPQIGSLYFNENKGIDQVGRMTRYEWARHYKLLNSTEGITVNPKVVNNINDLNLDQDCGKLVTLTGITMKDADGTKVFAPSDGSATLYNGCANREITGISKDVAVIRTSTYAKFANMPLPTGKVSITGIASRYRDVFQIMPRKQSDIKSEVLSARASNLGFMF